MIRTELLENGRLIRTYTDDETKQLLQVDTGEVYSDAVDIYPTTHVYEEVDIEEQDSSIEF